MFIPTGSEKKYIEVTFNSTSSLTRYVKGLDMLRGGDTPLDEIHRYISKGYTQVPKLNQLLDAVKYLQIAFTSSFTNTHLIKLNYILYPYESEIPDNLYDSLQIGTEPLSIRSIVKVATKINIITGRTLLAHCILNYLLLNNRMPITALQLLHDRAILFRMYGVGQETLTSILIRSEVEYQCSKFRA